MEREEIIKFLEETSSKEPAFLLTSWLEQGQGAVLEGNSDGFNLLAAKLLEASAKQSGAVQQLFSNEDFKTWIFDEAHNFPNIVCVHNLHRSQYKTILPTSRPPALKDKLLKIIFFTLMLFTLINFIVGLVTIIKWIV